MATPLQILICDDHIVIRAGLRLLLEPLTEFQVVGEVATAEQLLIEAQKLRPDVVITDLSMPGMGGLNAIPRIRQVAPEAKIIVFTVHEDEAYFFRALKAGAAGYVLKGASSDELLAAIRLVIEGGVPIPLALGQRMVGQYQKGAMREDAAPGDDAQLSSSERAVMNLIGEGCTNREIATRLSISLRTVERHSTSILNKFGLHNRAQLISYAMQQGILDTP
jgi:two-component system, NarL family, response regulator NreC